MLWSANPGLSSSYKQAEHHSEEHHAHVQAGTSLPPGLECSFQRVFAARHHLSSSSFVKLLRPHSAAITSTFADPPDGSLLRSGKTR